MIRIASLFLAALVVGSQAQAQSPAPVTEAAIYFEPDSDGLTIAGFDIIDEWVGRFRTRIPPRLYIEGHTSTLGGDAHNVDLSWRRAMSVRDALVARGIASSRIAVGAYGETAPARWTVDGVHEPLNDRVVIRAPDSKP